MRTLSFAAAVVGLLLSSCSEAQTKESAGEPKQEKSGKKKGKKGKGAADIANLTRLGSMNDVPESSGLALAEQAGTFYTHGDEGARPTLYKVDATGRTLAELEVPVQGDDWESITRDTQGNLYIGDVGNNNNHRRDLVIYRLNPRNVQQVQEIKLKYSDQQDFPPAKQDQNFDCEATLWHAGKVYLFTKDRGQSQTSKVYTVPDQPGTYTAQLLTKLAIPGEVTDAALSPDGRRLVLLARQEMFVLEGGSLAEALKATPRQISLKGAGQTEGATFTDNGTLYISSEQGALYKYTF
ncbi:SdiA-regulated domain-containing protein [Hymenobacter sublimis]|uniref:SdiA-regulated domain-containing protein n=1 Tax=Hymenobacter sublimis TaxID=2933777 RepID=A0ABY4JBE7_9BACT|nr:SdiA-regulated domain-containing protein [Hymenobacter sublimis]UPL49786.1 SdiA-regulated domain-containing protein [Hymenobacter sublimis]